VTSPHGEANHSGGDALAAGTGEQDDLSLEELAAKWDEDKPPAAGPMANVASAVVLGIIAVAGIIGSLSLGLGTPSAPRPGMYPFIVSVVLLVLVVVLAAVGRGAAGAEKFTNGSWAVFFGAATLVGLVLLIPVIGFEIPSVLLTFIWLRFLGKESWRMSILLSVVIVAAFYAFFVILVGVPLPHLF
jgi:hypothetical protein